ncbi:type III secretion system chaperone [Vibrio sp. MMG022]|uniref:CesT family type III secretion system chaperone n=1 Tax=Vibrio sp. MMG023 TaxID=2909979 RepID=UPI001F43E612|nr:CesT family type III secretion system chaperone [Vibrio sp. MMG023]MCF6452216.1 type III secretion system chaperone [Vibrio sp. MMG023]
MVNGFISTLLNDFAKRCQIETLEFDEEGCCRLIIDNEVAITLRTNEEKLTLIGLISGEKPQPDVYFQHMKAALTKDEPYVCWDEGAGYIGFIHIHQTMLTETYFETSIAQFVDWLKLSASPQEQAMQEQTQTIDAAQFATLRV